MREHARRVDGTDGFGEALSTLAPEMVRRPHQSAVVKVAE
jgi:hypothetical protein